MNKKLSEKSYSTGATGKEHSSIKQENYDQLIKMTENKKSSIKMIDCNFGKFMKAGKGDGVINHKDYEKLVSAA